MGISTTFTVACDADDCMQWASEQPTRRHAIESAQRMGFRRTRDGGWQCPTHRPDLCGEYGGSIVGFCLKKAGHEGDHW